jgi:hypothetical protein
MNTLKQENQILQQQILEFRNQLVDMRFTLKSIDSHCDEIIKLCDDLEYEENETTAEDIRIEAMSCFQFSNHLKDQINKNKAKEDDREHKLAVKFMCKQYCALVYSAIF